MNALRIVLSAMVLLLACAATACAPEDEDSRSADAVHGVRPAVIGTLTSVGNRAARTAFEYDGLGRVVVRASSLEGKAFRTTVRYGYPAGRTLGGLGTHVVEQAHTDGEVVRSGYDRAGRLARVVTRPKDQPEEVVLARVLVNTRGDVVESVLGDGTKTVRTYNPTDLRLRAIRTTNKDGRKLQGLVYEFDAFGNVRGVANELRPELSASFAYDSLDRLRSMTSASGTVEWRYDAAGNLTEKDGLAQEYADPKHAHALTKAKGTTYRYDDNGNLIETSAGLGVTYNAENMAVSASRAGVTVTRRYLGESAWKKVDRGATTFYPGDGERLELAAGEDAGRYRKTFAGGLAERDTDGKLRFYHSDHLGSSVLVTEGGEVVHEDAFAPYGEARRDAKRGSFLPKARFHGKEDDGLGFYDYGARLYMPEVGRWMTPDTLNAGTNALNRYTYASNNPLSRVDPDGHADFPIVIIGKMPTLDPMGELHFWLGVIKSVLNTPSDMGNLAWSVVNSAWNGRWTWSEPVPRFNPSNDKQRVGELSGSAAMAGIGLAKLATSLPSTIRAVRAAFLTARGAVQATYQVERFTAEIIQARGWNLGTKFTRWVEPKYLDRGQLITHPNDTARMIDPAVTITLKNGVQVPTVAEARTLGNTVNAMEGANPYGGAGRVRVEFTLEDVLKAGGVIRNGVQSPAQGEIFVGNLPSRFPVKVSP